MLLCVVYSLGAALNVIDNPSLEYLGLTSLRTITSGLVYIRNNTQMCYLQSLKWKKLQEGLEDTEQFIVGNANQTSFCGMSFVN